jgi:hypothetical protein
VAIILTSLAMTLVLTIGLASPAQAWSGRRDFGDWWVYWWAGSTYTTIEPHMFDYAAAAIYKYTGYGPQWFYGPYVYNGVNPYSHNRSSITVTHGSWIGAYMRHQGINHKLCC